MGLQISNGTLYQTKWSLVWELRGGHHEKKFYDEYIKNLITRIFNFTIEPKISSGGKNSCCGIQASKKILAFS